jgi:hypothetical protein
VTTRRGGRPSQVRPRPPSSGRPAPVKARSKTPSTGRLASHRRVDRTRRLALPFRVIFAIAIVALGAGVLFVASGGVGRVAAALGSGLAGIVTDLTSTPAPSATPSVLADSPLLREPAEPYTNQPTVDLTGTVPAELAGTTDSRIRIYVAIGDGAPGIINEIPVGQSATFIVPNLTLAEGTNTFTATIIGPAGESEPSPAIAYVLDTAKPGIVVSSPREGDVINAATVPFVGKTQPRSQMRMSNAAANATISGQADANGAFSIVVPIAEGNNNIAITSVDPAGNESTIAINVVRGSGALAASLSQSIYQIKRSDLPEKLDLTVMVVDPDGRPLEGARVTFSVAIPSVPAVTSPTRMTAADGTAGWSITVPTGATAGQISAVAIVSTEAFGETTDRAIITIAK